MDIGQSQNKVAKLTKPRWNPKEWKPEYERIVLASAIGLSGSQLAEKFGYTEPWISQILNSNQAKIILELIVRRTREYSLTTLPERLEKIHIKAFQRIESVINDDDMFERSPLAIFDRSVDLLKRGGVIKNDSPNLPAGTTNNVTNNTLIVNATQKEEILESLRLSK